jgi:septum formation protein
LLGALGLKFEVFPAGIEEPSPSPDVDPAEYALSLASLKAEAIARGLSQKAVLAADTIVVVEGQILGKPGDLREARKMLETLSGRWHEVITAYAILWGNERRLRTVGTKVLFKELVPEEIEAYLLTGEPSDKAGAYAIQGLASYMVRRIEGSVTNVIGLPLTEVIEDLLSLKIITWEKP